MFSPTVGKSKCSYALSEVSYFYELEEPGAFGVRKGIFAGYGDELFKTYKARSVPEKAVRIESLAIPHTSQFTIDHCLAVRCCMTRTCTADKASFCARTHAHTIFRKQRIMYL